MTEQNTAPTRPKRERQGRRRFGTPLLLSAIVVAQLSAWYIHPQPQLDVASIQKIAAERVGSGAAGGVLDGTVVAVTGATSGIGLELTSLLHGWGATVVAIGRSTAKLDRLRARLDGEEESRLVPIVAQLNDLRSVSDAADKISERFRRIDFLVNNAGMHYSFSEFFSGRTTIQGYDMAFGVNYLSHVLLTEKLLPLLQESKRNPRIIQVSSSFHWLSDGRELVSIGGDPPPAAQPSASFFHALRSYPNSKLAQILHARALSRELMATTTSESAVPVRVEVASACPGWVGTPIGGWFNYQIMSRVAFPPDGFGLASILEGMFRPPLSSAGTKGREEDWVVNSKLFHLFGEFFVKMGWNASWTSTTGFRDGLVWVVGVGALYVQKFFGEVIWSTSSRESYSITLQDSLYYWSKEAVSEWL